MSLRVALLLFLLLAMVSHPQRRPMEAVNLFWGTNGCCWKFLFPSFCSLLRTHIIKQAQRFFTVYTYTTQQTLINEERKDMSIYIDDDILQYYSLLLFAGSKKPLLMLGIVPHLFARIRELVEWWSLIVRNPDESTHAILQNSIIHWFKWIVCSKMPPLII